MPHPIGCLVFNGPMINNTTKSCETYPPPLPCPPPYAFLPDMDYSGRISGSGMSGSFTSSAGMTSGSFDDEDDDDDMSSTPSSDYEDADSGGEDDSGRRAVPIGVTPAVGDVKSSDTPLPGQGFSRGGIGAAVSFFFF